MNFFFLGVRVHWTKKKRGKAKIIIWILLQKITFFEKTLFYIRMSWGSRVRSKACLTIAACRDVVDVVEAVKSSYIPLSLISAARHPLHQAISLLFSVFFFTKIGFMLKNIFLKISYFDTSLFLCFFCWKENSHVKNCCLYISFFDPLIIFQLFLFFPDLFASLVLRNTFFMTENSLFLLFLCFCWDEHPTTTIFTPTTPWPVELCDSLVKVLGECWDDSHKSKCNQVCLFAHVDEVVPSGCWRVAASWLFFSLFVLHAWCSGSVRVDCCA